jgi:ABC-type dipeptide/oligopeptide/nickel transport system permease subunit
MLLRGRLLARRGARVGLGLVLLLLAFAALGPALGAQDPNASDFLHGAGPRGLPAGPSLRHPLGTDALFRDELSRLAHGARLSLAIAFSSTLLSAAIGGAVGVLSGYLAGGRFRWIDALLMRLVDVLLSFPYLLLVMAVGAALDGTSAATVLLVLGLTSWLGTARLIRAKTLVVREQGFVEAARALGQRTLPLLFRHIVPGVAGPLVVVSTVGMASMILAESVLSYLQVGVQPPTATWGRMLYEGQHSMTLQPRLVVAPGVAILLSVLGFNLLGEALRDALDPREIR